MKSESTRTGTVPSRNAAPSPTKIRHTDEGYRARGPSEQEAMRRLFARLEREKQEEK